MKNRLNRLAPGEHENVSKFDMRFVVRSAGGAIRAASAQLVVDGEPIPEKLPVDLHALVRALAGRGRFNVFTCGCGSAACAGVEEGVTVTRRPGRIGWDYRLPQSSDGFGSQEAWRSASTRHHHVFDRQQVLAAVHAALLEADRTHPEEVEYPPYGFERSDIGQLLEKVKKLLESSLKKDQDNANP